MTPAGFLLAKIFPRVHNSRHALAADGNVLSGARVGNRSGGCSRGKGSGTAVSAENRPNSPDRLSVEELRKRSGIEFMEQSMHWLPGASATDLAALMATENNDALPAFAADAIYLRGSRSILRAR